MNPFDRQKLRHAAAALDDAERQLRGISRDTQNPPPDLTWAEWRATESARNQVLLTQNRIRRILKANE